MGGGHAQGGAGEAAGQEVGLVSGASGTQSIPWTRTAEYYRTLWRMLARKARAEWTPPERSVGNLGETKYISQNKPLL